MLLIAVFWGANWPVLKIALREAPVFWFRLVCVWGSAIGLMAVAWAWGVVLIKRRPFPLAPTVQTAWMMAAAGVPLVPLALLHGGLGIPELSLAAWLAVAYNVLIAGVICYWAFYKLVTMLPAHVAGISSLSVPVVGMATGVVFLGEIPTWSDWIALCLIISALALVLIWPAVGRKAR